MSNPDEVGSCPKRPLREAPVDTQDLELDSYLSQSTSRSSTGVSTSSFGSTVSRSNTATTWSSENTSLPSPRILPLPCHEVSQADATRRTLKRDVHTESHSLVSISYSSTTKRRKVVQHVEQRLPRGTGATRTSVPAIVPLYESLPLLSSLSIRLLRLLPARSLDSPLVGELHVAKLDACPVFEGLSYTWSSPTERETLATTDIQIFDQSISITGNLGHALRRLRYLDRSRDLWIDSLCIDQGQPKERRYQIDIMEQIYSAARRVIAWLGEDSSKGDGKYVFDFCDVIDRRGLRPHYMAVARHREQWPNYKDLIRVFAGRRYFKRRWIIQEVCHANEVLVVCGERSAPLPVFSAALQKLPASRRPLEKMKEFCATVAHLRQALQDWRQQDAYSLQTSTLSDFIWMLQRFHDFKCSDDRDRLYAIVSLWKGVDVPECNLAADYEISCERLYLEFAHRLIAAHLPDPHVLNQFLTIAASQSCTYGSDRDGDMALPSWVVDWRLDLASRIGPDDVAGDLKGAASAPADRELSIETRCFGKIVEASGHYRDWVLLTSNGLRIPSQVGALADEDYIDTLGKTCPALQEGDLLCQPISTYWARKGHMGDAAIVIRPTRQSVRDVYRIVGRCPLDLFWQEAEGPERTTLSISTDTVAVILE